MIGYWAERQPNAPALLDTEGGELSYADLLRLTSEVRGQLRSLGIGPSDRVAVMLPNGVDLAVVILAVSSFAACMPLDPNLAPSELKEFHNRCGFAAVVTFADRSARAVEAIGGHVVESALVAKGLATRLAVVLRKQWNADSLTDSSSTCAVADDVALLLPTSGTTGRQKIVELRNRNLVASSLAPQRLLGLSQVDRTLNLLPLWYAHGLVNVLMVTLASGGSAVCSGGFDSRRFGDWLSRLRPTWYSASPAIHAAILDATGVDTGQRCLRFIRSAGSPINPKTLTALQ